MGEDCERVDRRAAGLAWPGLTWPTIVLIRLYLEHECAVPGGLRREARLHHRRQPLLPVLGRDDPGGGGGVTGGNEGKAERGKDKASRPCGHLRWDGDGVEGAARDDVLAQRLRAPDLLREPGVACV